MQSVLRPLLIYGFILLLFRGFGKRTLAQITTFDFVLLLIIGEATQQGLLGDDFSVTTAILVVLTLVTLETLLDRIASRYGRLGRAMEGTPVVIVSHGHGLEERLRRSNVDIDDVLEAARDKHGLERLEQVKYAVLERDGSISVIPY